MVSIATELCFPNIIDNHVADFFGSMLSGEKVARQRRCRHFRYVLVLGDGEHLFLGQAAKRDAIFQRDHGIKCISPFHLDIAIVSGNLALFFGEHRFNFINESTDGTVIGRAKELPRGN